jgi:hypothetical protein
MALFNIISNVFSKQEISTANLHIPQLRFASLALQPVPERGSSQERAWGNVSYPFKTEELSKWIYQGSSQGHDVFISWVGGLAFLG